MRKYHIKPISGYLIKWTQSAYECYKRGCQCKGCYYSTFFSDNHICQMKYMVLEIVKKIGLPTEKEIKQWTGG